MPGSAIVVGGGSGIGAAVAERHRAAGDSVLVWDVAGEPDIVCDISDPARIEAAMAETASRIGLPERVTISAGIGHGGLLVDASPEEWDRVMAVNARGPWLVMRAAARLGAPISIVVVSSVSARLVDQGMGLYCASKAALSMLVRVAAVEWAPKVRVNAVAPGVTDTPMLPPLPRDTGWLAQVAGRTALSRLGTAEDITSAILAVHDLEWVTGQVLECDGGLGLFSPIRG